MWNEDRKEEKGKRRIIGMEEKRGKKRGKGWMEKGKRRVGMERERRDREERWKKRRNGWREERGEGRELRMEEEMWWKKNKSPIGIHAITMTRLRSRDIKLEYSCNPSWRVTSVGCVTNSCVTEKRVTEACVTERNVSIQHSWGPLRCHVPIQADEASCVGCVATYPY